ncbi:MAG TPA: fused MFS/spermidine synthase [Gemmatimonadaceae bacterium]|nr:fused MFS/spermidine synthase [Gemmatimonadaceae bacterium]
MTRQHDRYLPFMLLLFIGSGCAALIYEIVWFQVLQLVIGSSAISLAVLLGTFMGGMFAGSLLLTRYVSRAEHPLRVYAKLEAAIGVCGAALIVLMPLVSRLYTAVDGGGPASVVLRAIVCVLLLLTPTMMMGATLPAISRYVEATPAGVSWLGFFYGGNIAGAVVGCLAAGFYLLRLFNLTTAALTAVALNAIVAGLGLLLSKRAPYEAPAAGAPGAGEPVARASVWSVFRGIASWDPRGVYLAIACSGLTALGAEVVWTRLLSLLFGATTYAFSVILAVFLIGLGIGSAVGSSIARSTANARATLGWVQLLLAFTTAYGAYMVSRGLPYWPVNPSLAPSAWFNFQIDLARALFTILPGAVLWGASFPLALAAATRPGDDPGATVGRVYAANTLGAIGGSLVTGLLLVPFIGTHGAQRVLIVLSLVSAAVALGPLFRSASGTTGAGAARPAVLGPASVFAFVLLALGGAYAATRVQPVPAGLVAWGRSLAWQGDPNALYVGEGINSSIAVTEEANGWRNFHVSGKVEASTEPQDMRLQRLLGHLTALMDNDPKSVLVVGFGAGVTAGAISIHPTIQRMVICEMEPLIPKVVSTYFADVNYGVATNPKVQIVYDDARHYVLTTREKFDLITSDPIHPWVKGAATLYTKEYFEHVKDHLNPGGVVTQWVPLYESTEDVVKSEIATFLQVFPHGTVWRNDDGSGAGYDVVLVGRLDDTPIDVDAWQAKLDSPAYAGVKASLAQVGFTSAVDILRTYTGRGQDLGPWVADAQINTDDNLRLQYLAGFGFNQYIGTQIRDSMMRYRKFPADYFIGQGTTVAQLQAAMMGGTGAP